MMTKYTLAILKNETEYDHLDWINACKDYADRIDYEVIDIVNNNWLENVTKKKYDFFLTRPPDKVAYYKQLYDERVYIISEILGFPIYPSLEEIYIYENKRMLSYFLDARKIPHPKTWIFYSKEEALKFILRHDFPIVAKTSIGAGGSGVKIIRDKDAAILYIEKAFSFAGIKRSYLPNLRKGNYLKRLSSRLVKISDTVDYLKVKRNLATKEPQKWFVIFQEFIQSDFEWRCVVVNDSYFGHKKLRTIGEKMSGTSKIDWDIPNTELLNLSKMIVTENNFMSQAIDLFYNKEKGYLVNEMQCFWGSKNPHQMLNDGIPGRFIKTKGVWAFQKGEFNQNNSFNLRLQHVLKMLDNK